MRQCWTCQLVKFEITEINFIRRLYRSNNHEPNSSEKKFCYFWLKKWGFFSTTVWKGSRHHLEARNAGGPISILIWYLLKKEGDFRHHRGWTNWIVTTQRWNAKQSRKYCCCWGAEMMLSKLITASCKIQFWHHQDEQEFWRILQKLQVKQSEGFLASFLLLILKRPLSQIGSLMR